MEGFDYIVFPSKSIQTDGIRAFSITSFGFGQKGAQAIGVHPKYLFATLDAATFHVYKVKVEARQKKAYRYFHDALVNNNMFQAKSENPYSPEQEEDIFLNPKARVVLDPKTGTLIFPKVAPKPFEDKVRTENTKQMVTQLAKSAMVNGDGTANTKVGVDVEAISAVNIDNETFVERNFTSTEQAYCRKAASPHASFAGRWSAKEAVFKALGVESKGAGAALKDIEIGCDHTGRPTVQFHGDAAIAAKKAGVKSVEVSISHSDEQAVAVAVATF